MHHKNWHQCWKVTAPVSFWSFSIVWILLLSFLMSFFVCALCLERKPTSSCRCFSFIQFLLGQIGFSQRHSTKFMEIFPHGAIAGQIENVLLPLLNEKKWGAKATRFLVLWNFNSDRGSFLNSTVTELLNWYAFANVIVKV